MSAGNRTVLVLMDSRKGAERRSADQTVFAALDHFGMAWEVLDGGDYMGFIPAYVAPRALYVIAHDGAAAWLKPETARQIADAVADGAGLVSFDRSPQEWPQPLRDLLPDGLAPGRTGTLRFAGGAPFITFGHEVGAELELGAEIATCTAPAEGGWQALATDAEGRSVVSCATVGAGRVVLFGTGNELYAEGVFGHVRGIDGLMWRALVWAAAKPFPMRCIPPFVTARMDDCNGTYNAFDYVRVMNRYGLGPNLGLFTDEMGPTDWAAARRLYDAGGADFSMHAFRDDFYMARPNYQPYAVLADKPDLSRGGQETRFEGLSLDHNTGLDLPLETIRRNFRRMDEAFAQAGLRHSRVLNAHFGEVGWPAVPLFLERGVDMPCNNSAIGQLYGNQPVWRPRPYGIRGPNGRHGLTIDRCPQHPGMTYIAMSAAHVGDTHMRTDILSGRVPFLDEAPTPQLDAAAQVGIANIKLGLDALAYGLLFTHEERINAISLDDWETIVTTIMAGLDGWEHTGAEREQVGIICKRLLDSRLVRANVTDQGLQCWFCGQTDGPSPLTVWENEGDGCVRRVVEVEPLDGYAAIVL
ncbi:MAG: hypothetical protein KKI08_05520 [Armatimonadetes bacterium]|nr:hypothetical protein [Armatimonadota bacterium]